MVEHDQAQHFNFRGWLEYELIKSYQYRKSSSRQRINFAIWYKIETVHAKKVLLIHAISNYLSLDDYWPIGPEMITDLLALNEYWPTGLGWLLTYWPWMITDLLALNDYWPIGPEVPQLDTVTSSCGQKQVIGITSVGDKLGALQNNNSACIFIFQRIKNSS